MVSVMTKTLLHIPTLKADAATTPHAQQNDDACAQVCAHLLGDMMALARAQTSLLHSVIGIDDGAAFERGARALASLIRAAQAVQRVGNAAANESAAQASNKSCMSITNAQIRALQQDIEEKIDQLDQTPKKTGTD